MSDNQKRVAALIANATDAANSEEARRTYAMQAVKLIKEQRMALITEDQAKEYIAFKRRRLPGIDIPPEQVWDEAVDVTKTAAKEKLENLAETLFGGVFDLGRFATEPNSSTSEHPGYIQRTANRYVICQSCNLPINIGSPYLEEFGPNAQKGTRRVTCTRDKCRATWKR